MDAFRNLPRARAALRAFLQLCEKNMRRGTPDTFTDEMETLVDRHLAAVGPADFEKVLLWFASRLREPSARVAEIKRFEKLVKTAEEQATRTPAGRDLFALLVELENGAIGAALPVFIDLVDPTQLSRDSFLVGGELHSLQRVANEEQAAHLLLQMAAKIAQPGYERLLRLLWRCDEVRDGKRRGFPALGHAVNELAQRYPNLVEPDFVHVRNAACHNGFRFDAKTSMVHLTDRAWTRAYYIEALNQLVLGALWASGPSMQTALNAYYIRVLAASGLVDATLEAFGEYPNESGSARYALKETALKESIRQRWPRGPEWTSARAA